MTQDYINAQNLALNRSRKSLLAFLFLSFLTGFIIRTFLQTPEQMLWYDTLYTSTLSPPNAVFAIVWTVIYILLALVGYLAYGKEHLGTYYMQFIAQLIWSFTFFVAHQLWLSVAVICCLFFIILMMIQTYFSKSTLAAILLMPYLAWVGFAAYLNIAAAILN